MNILYAQKCIKLDEIELGLSFRALPVETGFYTHLIFICYLLFFKHAEIKGIQRLLRKFSSTSTLKLDVCEMYRKEHGMHSLSFSSQAEFSEISGFAPVMFFRVFLELEERKKYELSGFIAIASALKTKAAALVMMTAVAVVTVVVISSVVVVPVVMALVVAITPVVVVTLVVSIFPVVAVMPIVAVTIVVAITPVVTIVAVVMIFATIVITVVLPSRANSCVNGGNCFIIDLQSDESLLSGSDIRRRWGIASDHRGQCN
eukprot:IDg9959t1